MPRLKISLAKLPSFCYLSVFAEPPPCSKLQSIILIAAEKTSEVLDSLNTQGDWCNWTFDKSLVKPIDIPNIRCFKSF
jgi:hypothetical protein